MSCEKLYRTLTEKGVGYFCGVPDSILSSFGLYLQDHAKNHDVAANEGNAIAMAIGYYFVTLKIPLVYMQNSGIGNAINPLTSLADPAIWGVPMILLIGWRGKPGVKDEPQHLKQGPITEHLLDTLGILYDVLSTNEAQASQQIDHAVDQSIRLKQPYAILVEGGTIDDFQPESIPESMYELSREQAIQIVAKSLSDTDIVVATTGKTSRELYEHREAEAEGHNKDLLVVGGMGHASSIALGIAEQNQDRKVYCLDGDGAVLMHMGALATIGAKGLKNFYHIVFNNGSHDSVGGQPTVAFSIDLPSIAKDCGYAHTYSIHDASKLNELLEHVKDQKGSIFIEIRISRGARPNLVRPGISPGENKEAFMKFIKEPSNE